MKSILFVHQSADLYGSDRVLLTLVTHLNKEKFHPVVVLPTNGPLMRELIATGIECHVLPITRLSRATLSLRGLARFPWNLFKSLRAFDRLLADRRIDLVHSNTLAVLTGAVWARRRQIKHVWHVHEIIQHPVIVRKVYAYLVSWLSDKVVCVSHATERNLLIDRPRLSDRTEVVWNGIARDEKYDEVAVNLYRQQAGAGTEEVLIALVGRINRLKGQRILVKAINQLWLEGIRNLRVVFVGSVVPGQEHFLEALQRAIDSSPARDCFKIFPFTNNVWLVWDACDIATLPSTEPESFGLVALEAMAASKPVIAANHGGLAEVVNDDETGLLVAPGDVHALADALRKLSTDAAMRSMMGRRGHERYQSHFTLEVHAKKMVQVYDSLLD